MTNEEYMKTLSGEELMLFIYLNSRNLQSMKRIREFLAKEHE